MFEVGVGRTFHALHQLEADVGPAEHEHDYRVEVVVRGPGLAENGMLLDLDLLGAAVSGCLEHLDASDLGELSVFSGRNTTVEVVAEHIWHHVGDLIGGSSSLRSLRVTVHESADAWASVDQPFQA